MTKRNALFSFIALGLFMSFSAEARFGKRGAQPTGGSSRHERLSPLAAERVRDASLGSRGYERVSVKNLRSEDRSNVVVVTFSAEGIPAINQKPQIDLFQSLDFIAQTGRPALATFRDHQGDLFQAFILRSADPVNGKPFLLLPEEVVRYASDGARIGDLMHLATSLSALQVKQMTLSLPIEVAQ